MTPIGGTPERLATYVKEDLTRWKRVVEAAGLKPEQFRIGRRVGAAHAAAAGCSPFRPGYKPRVLRLAPFGSCRPKRSGLSLQQSAPRGNIIKC